MPDLNPTKTSHDRLALLYHLSQAFNSSLDLDEVLNRVMDEVIVVTRAERGFVMLHEADGLSFRVARGIDQTTISDPAFQISRSVIERVASEGQPVLTSDAQTDVRFNMRQSVMILGLRSILCVPLKIKDKILGALYVDNRMQAGIFFESDLELLNAIAASAAIAIENARLYRLAVEKGRLERELQVARQVQASLLPHSVPQAPGWEFVARWLPARQVAGDYYDFIPVTAAHQAGAHLGLVIADVTDKGMPAALFMALTRSTVRASVDRAASPAEGIRHANQLICADATTGMFVTLFYSLLNPASHEMTYVNAGHNPPLLYRARSNEVVRLGRTGMALGVDENAAFSEERLHLERGDFILLYTDGVIDALNPAGQAFGMEQLQRLVKENCQVTAAELMTTLEDAVAAFTGSATPFDDITVVIAKRL